MLAMVHRLLVFCGPYARRIRLAYLFTFLRSLCATVPFVISIALINAILEGTATIYFCIIASAALICSFGLQTLFQYVTDRTQSGAGYLVFAEKRREIGAHLRKLPMGFFTEGNLGKVSSILSSDIISLEEMGMTALSQVVSGLVSQIIITLWLCVMSPAVGAVVLAVELIAMLIERIAFKEAVQNSEKLRASTELSTKAVLEYVAGLPTAKAYGASGESARDLHSSFFNLKQVNVAYTNEHAPFKALVLVLYALGTAAVIAVTVIQFEMNSLSLAMFIGILLFLFQLFVPIKSAYGQTEILTIAKSALDRIEWLLSVPELSDTGQESVPKNNSVEIEFEHVTFAYSDQNVLKDISFSVKPHTMLALVGQSGSGKSTIANLIGRFWDVKEGTIRIRGVDIRDMPLAVLMDQISMVFQDVYLFQGTVRENIAMGCPHASDDEILMAAKKARCLEFIKKMPYGFDTMIGEGGASVSGGEAQRLSIARALVKNAPIVILDEATASMDADNEHYVQEALSALCHNKTTIVIAHRLHTIRNADDIIVLDKGVIAEHGRHDQLITSNGAYARMVRAGMVGASKYPLQDKGSAI